MVKIIVYFSWPVQADPDVEMKVYASNFKLPYHHEPYKM